MQVATSKSVLAGFYFLWTSGFYVWTTKICKVLVLWTSAVKKTFFALKGGAVLRELTPNQHGLSSHYGVDGICGLSMLLVLSLIVPRGFSAG